MNAKEFIKKKGLDLVEYKSRVSGDWISLSDLMEEYAKLSTPSDEEWDITDSMADDFVEAQEKDCLEQEDKTRIGSDYAFAYARGGVAMMKIIKKHLTPPSVDKDK